MKGRSDDLLTPKPFDEQVADMDDLLNTPMFMCGPAGCYVSYRVVEPLDERCSTCDGTGMKRPADSQ